MIQIKLAMCEHARREASYRTRRGLEGKALKGADAGERTYGYLPGTKRLRANAPLTRNKRRRLPGFANGVHQA